MSSSGGTKAARVYRPENLARARAAYADISNAPFRIVGIGDSTMYGVGSDGTQATNDATGAGKNFFAQLRHKLELRTGTIGGELILPSDTRVTATGATTSTTTGPMSTSKRITGVGSELLFPAIRGTSIDVICWWQTGTTTPFTYSIDGGAVITTGVPAVSDGDYYITTISGLSDTTHTISIKPSDTNLRVYTNGVIYRQDSGPVTHRIGVPGSTSADGVNGYGAPTGQFLRQYRVGAINTYRPQLTVIQFGINDQSNNAALGGYGSNMRGLTDLATNPQPTMDAIYTGYCSLLDTVGGSALIISGPYATTVGAMGELPYWQAAKQIANENPNVAWLNMADYYGTLANSHAAGISYQLPSSVHSYPRGYARYADAVIEALES